jgi:hypothetical protein
MKSCSSYDVTRHQHGGSKVRTGSAKMATLEGYKNRFELTNFNSVCGKHAGQEGKHF